MAYTMDHLAFHGQNKYCFPIFIFALKSHHGNLHYCLLFGVCYKDLKNHFPIYAILYLILNYKCHQLLPALGFLFCFLGLIF